MNKAGERLYNGIIKENPTFVLMLGMCPTLAVTTSAMNGLGMGLTTAVVLTMSNTKAGTIDGFKFTCTSNENAGIKSVVITAALTSDETIQTTATVSLLSSSPQSSQ